MRVLFETNEVTLRYDEGHEAFYGVWNGDFTDALVKIHLEKILEQIKIHRVTLYLADLRDFRVAEAYDQEWVENDWYPRVFASGLKKLAVVMPTSFFDKVTVMDSVTRERDLSQEMFQTVEDAEKWLWKTSK